MTMSWIWTGLCVISLAYSIISGSYTALSNSIIDGASTAIQLCIGICGITCLWCGVMEIMKRCGIMEKLAKILQPAVRRILPDTGKNKAAMRYIAANISANLLGLGNAATPMGIKAVHELSDGSGKATNDMCTLTVLNSASIQLIPLTVAAIRGALGSASPFDIIPAVWITSAFSAFVGVSVSKLLGRRKK